MSCEQFEVVDVEAFLTDRGTPEHASFRTHFPGCAECAAAVARWSALDVALHEPPPEANFGDPVHPDPESLERFVSSPNALGAKAMTIQAHVDRCPTCRTELNLLERFEPAVLAAAGNAVIDSGFARDEAAAAGPLERLRGGLIRWLEELDLQRPLVFAAAAGIAILAVWQSGLLDGGAVTGGSDSNTRSIVQRSAPPTSTPISERPPVPTLEGEPAGSGGLLVDEAPESVLRLEAGQLVDATDATRVQETPSEEVRSKAGVAESVPAAQQLAQKATGPRESAYSAGAAASAAAPDADAASEGLREEMLLVALTKLPLPSYAAPAGSGSVGWMRQFGAVRGAKDAVIIESRAPDHVGLTLSSSPRLWWRISGPTEYAVEITLVDDEAIDPILRHEIEGPQVAGLQTIDLAAYGVELSPGLEYRWFVSLVVDPDRPSRNPVSAGSIRVVSEDDSRREAIERVDPAERGHALAELGLWYDAYDFFAGHSRAHPELARLGQHRDRMMAMARISP